MCYRSAWSVCVWPHKPFCSHKSSVSFYEAVHYHCDKSSRHEFKKSPCVNARKRIVFTSNKAAQLLHKKCIFFNIRRVASTCNARTRLLRRDTPLTSRSLMHVSKLLAWLDVQEHESGHEPQRVAVRSEWQAPQRRPNERRALQGLYYLCVSCECAATITITVLFVWKMRGIGCLLWPSRGQLSHVCIYVCMYVCVVYISLVSSA